jgi:hypothetical protein
MTTYDYNEYVLTYHKHHKLLINQRSHCLLSGNVEQANLIRNSFTNPILLGKSDWDIVQKPYTKHFGVIHIMNVLHYISDPATAIRNLLQSCDYLFIQDLIMRQRGFFDAELSPDGDCMRYIYKHHVNLQPYAFDLTYLEPKVIDFKAYECEHPRNKSFVMLIKS